MSQCECRERWGNIGPLTQRRIKRFFSGSQFLLPSLLWRGKARPGKPSSDSSPVHDGGQDMRVALLWGDRRGKVWFFQAQRIVKRPIEGGRSPKVCVWLDSCLIWFWLKWEKSQGQRKDTVKPRCSLGPWTSLWINSQTCSDQERLDHNLH